MKKLLSSAAIPLMLIPLILTNVATASLAWSEEEQITFDVGTDRWPVIFQDPEGTIWLVFTSDRTGSSALYIKSSSDGGETWTTPQALVEESSTIGTNIQRPSLLLDSIGTIWITWQSQRSPSGGDAEIYYICSEDLGVSWSSPAKPYGGESPWNGYYDPYIIEALGKIWIFFQHNTGVFCFSSEDGGSTWSNAAAITSGTSHRGHPASLLVGSELWLLYDSALSSSPSWPETDIYLMRTSDGLSWSLEEQLTSIAGRDQFPSIITDPLGTIYIVFDHTVSSDRDIRYFHSADNGATWSTPEVLTTGMTVLERTPGQTCSAVDDSIWVTYQRNSKIQLKHTVIPRLSSTINIDPNTLNLLSHGKWITAYIELPEGYNPHDTNVSTVLLNGTVPAELHPVGTGDEDGDGIPDLMVKFSRSDVQNLIADTCGLIAEPLWVTLTVTSCLDDGTEFEGSDTIRVICRGGGGIGRTALLY